jgi:hypothetical protein
MVSRQVTTGFVMLSMLFAAGASAQDQHERARTREQSARQAQAAPQQQPQRENRDRAVPRRTPPPQSAQQTPNQPQRRTATPVYQAPPRVVEQPRRVEPPRTVGAPRVVEPRRDYGNVAVPRVVEPRHDYGVYRGYVPRYNRGAARIVTPTIVTVAPYRPYVYRPSWSVGRFYGADGYYPYGYTPRAYYDPIPGRPYGGLRITGLPRDWQVFADGYYVGIVNDFDGVFQHLNLEAGPHHIEVLQPGGYNPPVAFDVYIDPGRTVTFRTGY